MILPVNQMVAKRAERLVRVISSKVQRQRVSHVSSGRCFSFFLCGVSCSLKASPYLHKLTRSSDTHRQGHSVALIFVRLLI